jgi:hypothetical protein
MQLKNKYYKYFQEISVIVGISEIILAEKIENLTIGDKFETQTHTIRLKKISESNGQMLYHICLYDNIGKLIRNDPIFLSQPKRRKHM